MRMKDFNINMTQYKSGDIITGTIVMIGETEVVVAIGGLKEGVFPKSELPQAFKMGDAILVMVTGQVDEKGCLIVTHEGVNKAIEDKEKLNRIKVGSEISFKVDNVTTSGLVGEYVGYRIFLPYSQCNAKDYINRDEIKNREISAIVIELDNMKKSIVCSSKLLNNTQNNVPVQVGDICEGTVIRLEEKYAIVLLENDNKAKLSITDVSYDRIEKLSDRIELNHKYTFKIIDANDDFSRISVGLKQLTKNPLDSIYQNINIGDEMEGEVVKILTMGAVIKLDNGLTAFAVTKENSDKAYTATHHLYKLGARVKGYISRIDKENYKMNIITNPRKDI